jgi:hypothetical protein
MLLLSTLILVLGSCKHRKVVSDLLNKKQKKGGKTYTLKVVPEGHSESIEGIESQLKNKLKKQVRFKKNKGTVEHKKLASISSMLHKDEEQGEHKEEEQGEHKEEEHKEEHKEEHSEEHQGEH